VVGGGLSGGGWRPVWSGEERKERLQGEEGNERERGKEEMRGAGRGLGGRGARLLGEPGQVEERSSIWASLLSLAEGPFSGEFGTAQVIRADLPNN
jgi:hypothetical protein